MQQERSFSLKESIPQARFVPCYVLPYPPIIPSHPSHPISSDVIPMCAPLHSCHGHKTLAIFRIVIPCQPNSSFSDAGICTPRKEPYFSIYHVPSHIIPLFLLIYPPLDWRSDGQSTMKMNSLRSHGFYIAILIVRYITIKSY
jgi:hypothetical protein